MPMLALANNLWVGGVPFELAILSKPERHLLSLGFTTASTYKLYPRSNRYDPEALQTGYRGNVSTYRLDTKEIAKYMNPLKLPHHPELLASTIAVTFVGPGSRPVRCMKGLFRVSRRRVLAGFRCLKAINPLYADIELDMEALNRLPEDDIPDSIAVNVRVEETPSMADNNSAYVPKDDNKDYDNREGRDNGGGWLMLIVRLCDSRCSLWFNAVSATNMEGAWPS